MKGVLRAPAEGEGGVARREDLTAAAAATLERSAGTVAQGTMAACERRRRRSKVSRGRRAGRARPVRCGRRVRVQRDSNGLWVPAIRGKRLRPPALFIYKVPLYLPRAGLCGFSQNLGKYRITEQTVELYPGTLN